MRQDVAEHFVDLSPGRLAPSFRLFVSSHGVMVSLAATRCGRWDQAGVARVSQMSPQSRGGGGMRARRPGVV
jgi:hypothetical protein